MARHIAFKNSVIQKQNFSYFLQESMDLKRSNLPYTKLQFMQIIEQHRDELSLGNMGGQAQDIVAAQGHQRGEFPQIQGGGLIQGNEEGLEALLAHS